VSISVCPFSTGSQYRDWQASNCERCTKFDPNKCDPKRCEIDFALALAYMGEGYISPEIAVRMGYDPVKYSWPCGEVEWTEAWKEEFTKRQMTGVA
jgi:hypothetical protein